jgi:hypothetical protein
VRVAGSVSNFDAELEIAVSRKSHALCDMAAMAATVLRSTDEALSRLRALALPSLTDQGLPSVASAEKYQSGIHRYQGLTGAGISLWSIKYQHAFTLSDASRNNPRWEVDASS